MAKERLYLFDTTLRDGQQTTGVDFSLEEKIQIAELLDTLGVDYVEGGYPGANPTDTEFFAKKRTQTASFVAFGMTKRVGRSLDNDPGFQALIQAQADAVCFVAKSWDYHVRVALGCTNQENLDSISISVQSALKAGKTVILDCEHFFDGYKSNRDYAIACAKTAYDAGARWVVLCDTNGGTLPSEIRHIVRDICNFIPGDHLGIHTHNDTEQAVANSLAAVEAGVRHIQGALGGLGERCGNANLFSLIPTLKLKPYYTDRFDIGVTNQALRKITGFSRSFNEILNRSPNNQSAYVGNSAFATKAGIHASALLKEPETYEHVPPESVGNCRRVMVSDQAGKSNLVAELKRFGIKIDKNDARLDELLNEIKLREAEGYAYEAADASLELLARRRLGGIPNFFTIDSFRVMIERRYNARQELVTVSEAIVKVTIGEESRMSVAEGNGPVNALDNALRKDLGILSRFIDDLELVDYKVRILNGGTEAVTRVLIESRNEDGKRWFTVGVSPNIIDASFAALLDSVTYKLLQNEAAIALVKTD